MIIKISSVLLDSQCVFMNGITEEATWLQLGNTSGSPKWLSVTREEAEKNLVALFSQLFWYLQGNAQKCFCEAYITHFLFVSHLIPERI